MADDPKKIVLADGEFSSEQDVSLLDILDHVLNTGVVIHGSLVVSLAGVDLLYVGLNAVVTSVETALKNVDKPR